MARPFVAGPTPGEAVLEKVDCKEGAGQVAVSECLVLVVLDPRLPVEVNVEELASVQRLRQGVCVVQAGHLLVSGFRIEAHNVAIIELSNECQRMADGRQEDITARFVGLRFKTDAEVVSAGLDVSRNGI